MKHQLSPHEDPESTARELNLVSCGLTLPIPSFQLGPNLSYSKASDGTCIILYSTLGSLSLGAGVAMP